LRHLCLNKETQDSKTRTSTNALSMNQTVIPVVDSNRKPYLHQALSYLINSIRNQVNIWVLQLIHYLTENRMSPL
jgi:hypothetical protein